VGRSTALIIQVPGVALACWYVRDADGAVGTVDVLPAGAARPEGVDPDILVPQLHIHLLKHPTN